MQGSIARSKTTPLGTRLPAKVISAIDVFPSIPAVNISYPGAYRLSMSSLVGLHGGMLGFQVSYVSCDVFVKSALTMAMFCISSMRVWKGDFVVRLQPCCVF